MRFVLFELSVSIETNWSDISFFVPSGIARSSIDYIRAAIQEEAAFGALFKGRCGGCQVRIALKLLASSRRTEASLPFPIG